MKLRHLFAELRRRNVLRAVVFYAGAVWALAQGIAQLAPALKVNWRGSVAAEVT